MGTLVGNSEVAFLIFQLLDSPYTEPLCGERSAELRLPTAFAQVLTAPFTEDFQQVDQLSINLVNPSGGQLADQRLINFGGKNQQVDQQLLNLLTLLRERVKAEAVFSNDEKGRNLRMLAYCLHAEDEREREY